MGSNVPLNQRQKSTENGQKGGRKSTQKGGRKSTQKGGRKSRPGRSNIEPASLKSIYRERQRIDDGP
jgi:hypothetical protein